MTEFGDWIAEAYRPELTLREWWGRLATQGWAFPTWPQGLGGRGLDRRAAREVSRVLAQHGAVGPPAGPGQALGAPTLIDHGTEEQRQRFLPALARGEEAWTQLFSEPGAGSDLASLQARATAVEGGWRITGQKVWNSAAQIADRGFLLARTDSSGPKHQGITYFVVDMDQPGVDVRPLRQMNGESHFCEVFLDDAWVPDSQRVGGVGAGWAVAQTTLAHERAGLAAGAARGLVTVAPGERAANLDLTVETVVEAARAKAATSQLGGGYVVRPRHLVELAREMGLAEDGAVRQQVADYYVQSEVTRMMRAQPSTGHAAAGSVAKLALSQLARRSRDLTLLLLGSSGVTAGTDSPLHEEMVQVALSSFATGLGGGTDEIQRNVIAERGLGLPREPSADQGTEQR